MSVRDKYQYAVVDESAASRIDSSDFVFGLVSDFNSFLKSADENIKSNKAVVHFSLGFFVLGLLLLKLFL